MKKYQNYTYLITGINKKTLSLAKSIRENAKDTPQNKVSIIITNASCNDNFSLAPAFKKLGCKLVPRDITEIHLPLRKCHSTIFRYLLLDESIEKNTRDALFLTRTYRERFAVEIYSISPGRGTELLFDSIEKGSLDGSVPPVKLRRCHLARNVIYHNLYENSMFELAETDHEEKVITIIIVGMNEFGAEMLRACLWCGQMDGFVLKIHIIDPDPAIQERFYHTAPEVASRNKIPKPGEDYYEITFHAGIPYDQVAFTDTLRSIKNPSWVFVSCGNDETNLETALTIRETYAQETLREEYLPTHYTSSKQKPFIQVVLENDDEALLLNQNQLKNYRNQAYDLHAVGNIGSMYSLTNFCNFHFEDMALQAHLRWGDEASFHNHEYNRRASTATAIHKKYRDIFYPENNILKDILEHKRWNAYMRSTEGYSFGLTRDDLARQHNSLVKFDDLSRPEKLKDTVMNQK